VRRKRRQSTQIIRKKISQELPEIFHYSPAKSGSKGWKLLIFFIAVSLLAIICYYLYSINLFDRKPAVKSDQIANQIPIEEPVYEQIDEKSDLSDHRIQIEILNGCGKNGVAKIFQSYLRENGFDVVNTENYIVEGKVEWNVAQSFVIDHIGVAERATAVARLLGISNEKVERRETQNPIYDLSVVIGKDYKNLITQ
jgi:hypothetical protein